MEASLKPKSNAYSFTRVKKGRTLLSIKATYLRHRYCAGVPDAGVSGIAAVGSGVPDGCMATPPAVLKACRTEQPS